MSTCLWKVTQVGDSWHRSCPHLSQVLIHNTTDHHFCPILLTSNFFTNIKIDRIPESLPSFMFRHPVLENILCFFAGFVVVITMGTGSKSPVLNTLMTSPLSLVQPLGGFSGDHKGATRHSPSLLLPHLLPQVLFKTSDETDSHWQGPEQWADSCGRQVEDARPDLLRADQLPRPQQPLLTTCHPSTSLTSEQTLPKTFSPVQYSKTATSACDIFGCIFCTVSRENENQ